MHQNIDFGFLICPFWSSQSYFPIFLDSLIDDPLIFPASLLDEAPLLPKSASLFLGCSISSNFVLSREYQLKRAPAYCEALNPIPYVPTRAPGKTLQVGAINKKLVMGDYL